jgi:hypothetical protein
MRKPRHPAVSARNPSKNRKSSRSWRKITSTVLSGVVTCNSLLRA